MLETPLTQFSLFTIKASRGQILLIALQYKLIALEEQQQHTFPHQGLVFQVHQKKNPRNNQQYAVSSFRVSWGFFFGWPQTTNSYLRDIKMAEHTPTCNIWLHGRLTAVLFCRCCCSTTHKNILFLLCFSWWCKANKQSLSPYSLFFFYPCIAYSGWQSKITDMSFSSFNFFAHSEGSSIIQPLLN